MRATSAPCEAATDTEAVVIGAASSTRVADVFARRFGDGAAVVVADEHTWEVAGSAVNERLAGRGPRGARAVPCSRATPTLYADYENIETLDRGAARRTTRSRSPSAPARSTTSSSAPRTSSSART